MALAETAESNAPLGRDQFVKRRQELRTAAPDGGPADPESGDEALPSALEGLAGEVAEDAKPAEGANQADPVDDLSFFDPDEVGEDEPSTLTGLKPPATMNAAEKESFESLPDEMKGYVARVHTSTQRAVQESGESLATRNKEIDDRVAALDRSLIEANAVLNQPIDDIPFTPKHSQEDLDALAREEDGFPAWQKAMAENEAQRASHDGLLNEAKAERDKQKAENDKKIKARQNEILVKFNEDVTRLIPAWDKPKARKKESKELAGYLSASGFSENELKVVTDARLVMLARKAMRYDAALAKRRDAKTTGKTGSATAKPAQTQGRGSAPSIDKNLAAADKRLRENPTADNFVAKRRLQREAAETNTRRRV